MIYKVTKTSDWQNKKPCAGAVKRPFENWETRTCTEKYFDRHFGENEGLWRSQYKNHRIDSEGYIERQRPDEMLWSIEINTLEELQSFIEKYGRIIMDWDSIEIYDGYRE